MDYANDHDLPAAIVSYDQAKAFDRVSHQYLFKVLRAFGFTEKFVNWVALLYTDITSSVIVNGFISSSFNLLRSIRQGCPLSALLYVLCIEPLAIAIRNDCRIQGLKIPGVRERARLSIYADDTNSFIGNIGEIDATLEWFQIYSRASGAKLNDEKCKGLWLGAWRHRTDQPFGFVWSDTLKINGVYFGENSTFQNCSMLKQKVDKMCDSYRSRHLTLLGRACICNVVICAQLWYVGAVTVLPNSIVTEINRKIYEFIWTGKFEAVNRRTLTYHPQQGGLGLVSIKRKLESLRCAHIYKFVVGTTAKWKYFAVYWVGLQLRRFDASFASALVPHAESPSDFYGKTIETYRKICNLTPVIEPKVLQARNVYLRLQTAEYTDPVVVSKFPQINFKHSFFQLNSRSVSPRARELEWRILHHVLPVNAYLYSFHITNNALCPFCRWPETLPHRVFSCKYVTPLWGMVEKWMSAAVGEPVTLSSEAAIFLQYPTFEDKSHLTRLQILCGELKLAVWMQRNRKKYDRAKITVKDIHRLFINFVRVRIRADFLRLETDAFAELWCQGSQPMASADGEMIV